MTIDARKPAEPGTPEDLGLDKPDPPAAHDEDAERVEDEGEPFDGNFA